MRRPDAVTAVLRSWWAGVVLDLSGGDGIVVAAHGSLLECVFARSHSPEGTCACPALSCKLGSTGPAWGYVLAASSRLQIKSLFPLCRESPKLKLCTMRHGKCKPK